MRMKRTVKANHTAVLAATPVLAAMLAVTALGEETKKPQEGAENTQVVIYHTNDVHGAVTWSEGSSIGLDRVAAMKAQTEGSILVDAGDATQGVPYASLTQGADIIDVMNEAGYDVMAPGNHEFDYGTEVFLKNAQSAQFPMIAANVYRDGSLLLEQEGELPYHSGEKRSEDRIFRSDDGRYRDFNQSGRNQGRGV